MTGLSDRKTQGVSAMFYYPHFSSQYYKNIRFILTFLLDLIVEFVSYARTTLIANTIVSGSRFVSTDEYSYNEYANDE